MQIPSEFLKETNYDGSRLIEITDERVLELKKQLNDCQLEMKPLLEEIKPTWDELDKTMGALQEAQKALEKVQLQRKPFLDKSRAFEFEKMMPIEQKAKLIADKLIPLINDIVKGELKEFETAKTTVEKDGKLFVEVVDEIEEKVKAIRSAKK